MNIVTLFICAYFLVTTILAIMIGRKKNNSRSYFGYNLSVAACVAIGAGEWMGGTSTTGVAEYGYKYGISGSLYTIANGLGILVLALFFAKLFRRTGCRTVSGIIGKYIGSKAGAVSGVMILITLIAVGISQMTAMGSLAEIIFGTGPTLSIIIAGLFVVLYTTVGGNDVIAGTNIIYIVVLVVGMVAALAFSVADLGIETIALGVPESYFNFSSIGIPKIISWIIASVLGACTAQAGLQPILCAKDENIAEKASFIIAAIVAPFGIITALLGMVASIYYPNIANPKMALPMLLTRFTPIISSIMLIALMSAIVSTASPIILSCGTIISKDLLRGKLALTEKSEEHRIIGYKLSTAISGLICIVLAVAFARGRTILDIVYFAYSIRGSLFIILLMGLFNRRYKEKQAIISMIMTLFTSIFWIGYKGMFGHYPIHPEITETYIAVIVASFSSIILTALTGEGKKDG